MRRLPGPAGDGLSDGGNSGSHRFVSGLAENTNKLNLLCGLFGVSDRKWMSGSAESRNHKPRGTTA